MANSFKSSAIPASGYRYQTLVGIRLLCDWLDSPALYEWVQFEADDLEGARGLDDIVGQRADRLLDLFQVKFTVDPFDPVNALSWRWLLQRKGQKGKSLLEKWSSAAFNIGFARLGKVSLITNRRPDAEFSAHLRDGKLEWAGLPEPVRRDAVEHLGGAEQAARFFAQFEFSHSYAGYESLERTVADAFESRHTDHLGWLTLLRCSFDWSIRKNSPAPDGRITLDVLRGVISERHPRPLDQEFRIPAGYAPPDQDFADEFVEQAAAGTWDARVVWGSPGQGKSTFLSYVCKRLAERDVSLVRHHYFLDLQETSDRISLKGVARSLIAQIQAGALTIIEPASDGAEHLRLWLSACGDACEAQGKRFLVVIDGLDHVWRENDERIAPLRDLFTLLLPLPRNTSLVLGTQRVAPVQLPSRMNQYLGPEQWVELPRMNLSSIRGWLGAQHEAHTFHVEDGKPLDQQITSLSLALERVSEGHPLVLTYTLLALARAAAALTVAQVERYAPEPLGDAHAYYQALWQRATPSAKDALHLMARDDFIWPAGALEACLDIQASNLEAEIGHLLATVDAGLVAFHGSLYVFISSQPDHQQRIRLTLPSVRLWLSAQAPAYLRWAWLWLHESRLGDHADLLAGTTRSWAIEALARAYPTWQIIRILDEAEEVAFVAGDYDQATRKRWLRSKIENGLPYQLDDAAVLEGYALRLTPDPYPALLLASEVSQTSVSSLHQLATLCLSLKQVARATEIQQRMRNRINDRIRSGAITSQERDEVLERYLEVAAGTKQYDASRVVDLVRHHAKAVEVFEDFLRRTGGADDLSPLMFISREPMPARLRRVLEVEAVRTAAWSQAKLHEWSEFGRFTKHPLSACWRILYASNATQPALPPVATHEALDSKLTSYEESEFSRYIHFLFFGTVARVLKMRGAKDPTGFGVSSQRVWLNTALGQLGEIANTCGALLARGEYPAFSLVYRLLSFDRPAINEHESWSDLRTITRALTLITADLFFLSRPRSNLVHVSSIEWEKCHPSQFFALHQWREIFLKREYRLLPDDVVRSYIEGRERGTHSRIAPFNEKASEFSDMCSWAAAYELPDLAHRLLVSAYRCAIGYGWRKDWRLPSILGAVELVSHYDTAAAANALERLAPIYTNIDEMTESSGANKSDLAEILLKVMPDTYARYYRYWLDRSEWYEADRTFAAFVKTIGAQTPVVAAVAAFLWEPHTRSAIRPGSVKQLDSLAEIWSRGSPEAAPIAGAKATTTTTEEDAKNESPMPAVETFPPARLTEFSSAVRAAKQYSLARKWFVRWFRHWESLGQGTDLLRAISSAMDESEVLNDGTELLDLAFDLSFRLEGPSKAFQWLVEAHRHRYGWSEEYHGRDESTRRIALVAQHYPKRWVEFVTRSSVPVPGRLERRRAIRDVVLINLLLQVGQVSRAAQLLETVVDLTLEEFETQPLVRPAWLDGAKP